jgi:hypothetical protein
MLVKNKLVKAANRSGTIPYRDDAASFGDGALRVFMSEARLSEAGGSGPVHWHARFRRRHLPQQGLSPEHRTCLEGSGSVRNAILEA